MPVLRGVRAQVSFSKVINGTDSVSLDRGPKGISLKQLIWTTDCKKGCLDSLFKTLYLSDPGLLHGYLPALTPGIRTEQGQAEIQL